jgi:uncharacterized membrane protein YhaH (DUF805 family)
MDQKWRLNRSGRIARNLLWLMVLLIVVSIVLVLRSCTG